MRFHLKIALQRDVLRIIEGTEVVLIPLIEFYRNEITYVLNFRVVAVKLITWWKNKASPLTRSHLQCGMNMRPGRQAGTTCCSTQHKMYSGCLSLSTESLEGTQEAEDFCDSHCSRD